MSLEGRYVQHPTAEAEPNLVYVISTAVSVTKCLFLLEEQILGTFSEEQLQFSSDIISPVHNFSFCQKTQYIKVLH